MTFPNVKIVRGAGWMAGVWVAAAALLIPAHVSAQSAEELRLTIGKSVVIDYPDDIRQISTTDPAILDASPITTREILVNAKGLGTATMVVWSNNNQRMFYNITVDLNVDSLMRTIPPIVSDVAGPLAYPANGTSVLPFLKQLSY